MEKFTLQTTERTGMTDITRKVQETVTRQGITDGICMVFIPHTTAAVTINENADPDVQRDMTREIDKVIPFEDGYHHFEGNSAAHIKTTLTGSSEMIVVESGKLQLGRWQGIYFCEYDGPRTREVWIKVSGS
jgi:secondary thiamine-phosphate synthase enzyme